MRGRNTFLTRIWVRKISARKGHTICVAFSCFLSHMQGQNGIIVNPEPTGDGGYQR